MGVVTNDSWQPPAPPPPPGRNSDGGGHGGGHGGGDGADEANGIGGAGAHGGGTNGSSDANASGANGGGGWDAPAGTGYGPPLTAPYPGGYGGPGYGGPGYGGPGYPGQGPGGWTPPPKPGLIPLRPLSFGQLMSAPFQVLRRNPKAAFGSGLLIQGVSFLLAAGITGLVAWAALSRLQFSASGDRDTVTAGSIAAIVLSILVPIALSLVGSALLQGVIVIEVARGTLGEKLRLGQLWRRAGRRLWLLIGWLLLIGLAFVVAIGVLTAVVWALVVNGPTMLVIGVLIAVFGGLALLALFIWLGTKLSLVPSVIVLEHRGIGASIARSWSLTHRFFWRTFGVQVLIMLILNVVAQIVVTPLSFVFGLSTSLLDPNKQGDGIAGAIVLYCVITLVSLVVGAISAVVQAAASALIYIDLRMRKDGLDLQLTRYVEARQAGAADQLADPYLPAGAPQGSPWS